MIDEVQTPGETILSLTNHEIYVVTAAHNGKSNGQIATWIIPASLARTTIRLIAAISPMNFTHDFIMQSGRFAVSMLASHQTALVPHFGLKSGREIDKLTSIECDTTPMGIPVPRGTCGWIECSIIDSMNGGDRLIYLAKGTASSLQSGCVPLRKREAFNELPPDVREQLAAKQARDGIRDADLLRKF